MPSTSPIWTSRRRRLAAAAAQLLLAGCIAETALPTFSAAEPGPHATASGRLRLDGTCLRLDAAGAPSFLIAWPHGARIDYERLPPLIHDGAGGSARVGEIVRLRGVPISADAVTASRKVAGIVRRCGGPLFGTYGFVWP